MCERGPLKCPGPWDQYNLNRARLYPLFISTFKALSIYQLNLIPISDWLTYYYLPYLQFYIKKTSEKNVFLDFLSGMSGTDRLQRVNNLPIRSSEECRKIYSRILNRNLPRNFSESYVCAGIPDGSKDSCVVSNVKFYFLFSSVVGEEKRPNSQLIRGKLDFLKSI